MDLMWNLGFDFELFGYLLEELQFEYFLEYLCQKVEYLWSKAGCLWLEVEYQWWKFGCQWFEYQFVDYCSEQLVDYCWQDLGKQ